MIERGSISRLRVLVSLVLLLALSNAASAGQAEDRGIDCAKAVATPDVTLCVNDAYEAADKRLNAAYRVTMAAIDKSGVPAEGQREWRRALVEPQRRWIAYRDAECELTGFQWYGGTGRSAAILSCAQVLTEARTKELRRHADPR